MASFVSSSSSPLENHAYLAKAFAELLREDGLLVFGRGLGLQIIVSKFLRLYGDRKRLVFVLNASTEEVGSVQGGQSSPYDLESLIST